MKLSSDYLREALEKMGDISQNKKAERLGISSSGMSQYMTGKKIMDDFACIMVAKILGIDGMVVIAAAQMEREKNQARKDVWEDLLKKMGALALGGLTAGAMVMGSLSADRAAANFVVAEKSQHDMSQSTFMQSVYYVKSRRLGKALQVLRRLHRQALSVRTCHLTVPPNWSFCV